MSNSAGQLQQVMGNFSSGGGKNIQKGGEPTEELEQEMQKTLENTVKQTMIDGCGP